MKGDFTRGKVTPAKSFTGVVTQQGRVQLDADYNEPLTQLRRYLAANPAAQDTVEGIRQSWLPSTSASTSATLDAALAALVAEGLLVKTVRADGKVCYRRRPAPPP